MKRNILTLVTSCIFACSYGQHINENSLAGPRNGVFDLLKFKKRASILSPDSTESDFKPNLKALVMSADIMVRPEDITAGNFLAPKGTGNYSEFLWGRKADETLKIFRGMYAINLEIQSPITTTDTITTLNRILSSGGVGNISGILKAGVFGDRDSRGITLSVIPTFSWQNGKRLKDSDVSSFAFGSVKSSLTLWTGPIVLAVQGSYNYVLGDSDDVIAKELDKKIVWTGMIALSLDNGYYFQFRALLPDGKFKSEMMEFSIVKSINLN